MRPDLHPPREPRGRGAIAHGLLAGTALALCLAVAGPSLATASPRIQPQLLQPQSDAASDADMKTMILNVFGMT